MMNVSAKGEPRIYLSLVIPAYNEERSIESVIREHVTWLMSMRQNLMDWEIVVMDDASQDGTVGILEVLSKEFPKLRVCRHSQNQGIFASFTDLFHQTRGTHILATASDGQWPVENLAPMLRTLLDHDCDLVVGVRSNRRQVYSRWRRVVSKFFNGLPRILFGVETHDAGSIKLGRREVFLRPTVSRGGFMEAERIIQTVLQGGRVEFVPIRFLPRGGGKASGSRPKYLIQALWDMIRCWFHYRAFHATSSQSRNLPNTQKT